MLISFYQNNLQFQIKTNNKIMKTFLTFLILFICSVSYSQPRAVDTRTLFLTPINGTFYQLPTYIYTSFSVYNQGPDSAFVGDTLVYQFGSIIKNKNPYKSIVMSKAIPPNDSIIIYDTLYCNAEINANYTAYIQFDYAPNIINRNIEKNRYLGYDHNFEDNRVFFSIIFEKPISGILDMQNTNISMYPNPNNTGKLQLKSTNNNQLKSIEIYSIEGKLVRDFSIKDSKTSDFSMDISDLKMGIYLVKIIDNKNFITNQKIIIN